MYLSPIMYVRTLQCFFNFPNVGKEVVRQKLVFLLSSRYFSIIRASSCELVKSSTNENSDNIFCLFPPRGCRVSLITEQLSFTHHILLFVSSKKEGVLEMRGKTTNSSIMLTLGKGSIEEKKNVFFRALPELPKPPP